MVPVNAIVATSGKLVAKGRFGEALACVDEALQAAPDATGSLFAKGSVLFDWGRVREALSWYSRAAAAGCMRPSLPSQLAWCYFRLGDLEAAERRARQAVACEPESTSGFYCLGLVLRAQKRFTEAVAVLDSGLSRHPADFHLLALLSGCHLDLGTLAQSEDFARRAIESSKSSAAGWSALGAALERQCRYEEALGVSEAAWQLEVENDEVMDCFVGLSHVLSILGRVGEALAYYEEALPQRPSVIGHSNYAFALLSIGRFAEGWCHYEFRWLGDAQRPSRPHFVRPLWDGQDIRGKTILLRAEQGVGDIVQFVRYAPLVKALGAMVCLRIRPGLERLAACFPGIDRFVSIADEDSEFDYHIPLLSLPRIFGTGLGSIPADVPYLRVDSGSAERWAARLSSVRGLKIGVVWAGNPDHVNDRNRSIPLLLLKPIFGKVGAKYYSLQVGRGTEELVEASSPPIEALGSELKDFTDTVALISALDLLICVDTSVAHLAGALGKEVWVLLPTPADWRWLRDREDSPWYPTMRLFRQKVPGEWKEVIERVADALDQRQASGAGDRRSQRSWEPTTGHAFTLNEYTWSPAGHRPGFSAVTETRMGIMQYLPDLPDVGLALGCYGEFLQLQIDLLSRLLKPGMTVLEVGAGCGAHALSLSQILGPRGHLVLCESEPLLKRILQQNLAANGVLNATVMSRPLGRPSGTIRDCPAKVQIGALPIEAFDTIDDLRLEQLELLKCGVGVDSVDVLNDASETLWRLRPWLFLAVSSHDDLTRLKTCAELHGYRCWKMVTPWFDSANFNRRERDLFDGRSALALVAFPEEVDVDVALAGCSEL